MDKNDHESKGNDDLSLLRNKKRGVQGWITRLQNEIDALSPSSTNLPHLEIIEERLRSLFSKYEDLLFQIIELDPSLDDGGKVEQIYTDSIVKIKQLAKLLQNDVHSDSNTKKVPSTVNTKLPTITIPPFSGKYSEYKPFIGLFNSLIHNNDNLDNIQKLYYLRGFLRGEASDLIKNLPLLDSSYEESLQIIKARYDNEFLIKSEHINMLLDIQTITRSSAVVLRQFLTKITQNLASLKNLGVNIENCPVILTILLRKLDILCSREYQIMCSHEKKEPSLNNLMLFLDERARALENSGQQQQQQQLQYHPLSPEHKVLERVRAHYRNTGQRVPYPPQHRYNRPPPPATMKAVEEKRPPATMKAVEEKQPPAAVDKAMEESTSSSPKEQGQCIYCKSQTHKLFNCAKFKLLPPCDRLNFVTGRKLCKICLNRHVYKCRYHFICNKCKGSHNSLIHVDKAVHPVSFLSETDCTQVLLPTVQVKIIADDGREVIVKALLDSGSQMSFITKDLMQLLKLNPKPIKSRVLGIGNNIRNLDKYVTIKLHSLIKEFQIDVSCFVLDRITTMLPQEKIDISKIVLPSNISLADKDFHKPSEIHLLIGADVFFQMVETGSMNIGRLTPATDSRDCVACPPATEAEDHHASSRHLNPSPNEQPSPSHMHNATAPTIQLLSTHFGHVIAGKFPFMLKSQNPVSLKCTDCREINENVKTFWQSEKVPEIFPEKLSEHDTCQQLFKNSVKLENNQFTVELPTRLPLDSINSSLGDSFHLALKRFHNLEIRLQKDSALSELYTNFINEYLDLGHGSIVDINQFDFDKDPLYFLPHHPVIRMDKITNKCRTVFDGSMKTNKKISLNDLLLNGPVVQRELFDILILARVDKYIFVTDIRHMFRAINMNEKYRSLQNILWRDSPNKNVQCIQLNTVTYGLKSSTYLATRCLAELAERYREQFPVASFILHNQTYVDDVLATAPSIELLLEAKEQLCELLKMGGFQLHKWSSNAVEVLKDIPTDKQYFDNIELQKDNLSLKTLGLNYNVSTDTLNLASPTPEGKIPDTKRGILSYVSRFYDPLGIAGPLVVCAKAILQKIWQSHVDWDSIIDQELKKAWHEFYESLIIMKPISINRHVNLENAVCIQLIGFADASSSIAHGCCIYIRVVDSTGNVKVSLLCSKSRINPINQSLTTPKLELNAALLLSKLSLKVYNTLSLKIHINNVILYSDSQVVLAWIKTDILKLKTYVANRVKAISENTADFTWAYVTSEQNPADCLSRGALPHELQDHHLWWKGNSLLHESKYEVPSAIPTCSIELPEMKDAGVAHSMVCTPDSQPPLNLDFLDKYSQLHKMTRVLAYVLRFCNNIRNKSSRNTNNFITSREIDESLSLVIKYEQQKCMKDVIHSLQCKQNVNNQHYNSLCPFIDDKGLVRVGGRLQNSNVPYAQKHPIILPKGSRIIQLIVNSEHLKNLHAGPRLILSSINQKYWIINAIREIKKVIHKCIICWKLKKHVSEQLMGNIPKDRVNICRPFQKIGIDFAGPISVKMSSLRKSVVGSGYICVIVCFVTKAVHLELCSDLKTSTFLACLKRFISRRGLPSDIYCDNASTFKCADTELQKLYKLHSSKEHQSLVQSFSAEKGINFHFIPCYSPIVGGLWESNVKVTKYHLKRTVQRSLLTYEQLNTVLCEIEAILNSRPLLPISNDVNNFSYLTPGHFIIGTSLNSYPEKDVSETPVNRLKFWELCNNMKQSFWKVWSNQYLNTLQCRPKWKNVMPNLTIGSLVILKEDNSPPMYWPMARITNVFPGSDNLVRTVEVKTANGRLHRRSVTKVCLLPIEN